MIYINSNSEYVVLPKHKKCFSNSFSVRLKASTMPDHILVDGEEDMASDSMFYKFLISDASDLSVGEYEYIVINEEGENIENGLLTFGDYVRQTIISADMQQRNIQFKKR